MTADPFPHLIEIWNERVGAYKAAAEERGKKPFIVMMRDGWVADTFEEAAGEFGTHFVEEWLFYFRLGIFTGHPDLQTEADITPENCAKYLVMGTPQQCIEQLEMFHEDLRRRLLHDALPLPDGAVDGVGARADPEVRRGGRAADPQEVPGAGPSGDPRRMPVVRA